MLFIIFGRSPNGGLISPFVKPDLKSVVEDALYQTGGRYGIFIKNLKSGESYQWNESEKFDSGSLYKLNLMVLVFEQIKTGKLAESDTLSADIKDLNDFFDISEKDAELKEGTINFTINSALEQMITISHNYAALALTKKTKGNNLAQAVTPKEIAAFFEDLYKGKIIDGEYSKKMMELLSRQKINDRIPKLLPQGVIVAHKTADFNFFEHDVGIVFTPKGDYILVVLSESNMPDAAGDRIAKLSRAVYEYFTN